MSELSKIKWRCRRGVKELDIVLCNYLDEYYKKEYKDTNQQALTAAFQELLELEDPALYALLLGEIETANKNQQVVLKRLRKL